jgi:hypothetical protein
MAVWRVLLDRAGAVRPSWVARRRAMTPTRTLVTPLSAANGRRPDPVLRSGRPEKASEGDFPGGAMSNSDLRSDMVPTRGASWAEVDEFALSYDGYAHWSDVAELANRGLHRFTRDRSLPGSLDELRGCLFYEQRRWHHFGEEPHGRGAEYVWALLDAICDAVRSADGQRPADETPQPSTARVAALGPLPRPVVVCFTDDDEGYLAWIAGQDAGFVVNAGKGRATGLRLHKGTCSSVRPAGTPTRSLTGSYRKICSADIAALLDWCADEFGADPEPCQRCRP